MRVEEMEKADVIFVHGKIYTVDISVEDIKKGKREFPIFKDGFLAVKGNRIVSIGEVADGYSELVGSGTKVIDLGGKTVIPGMIDSHCHLACFGDGYKKVSLKEAKSVEDMVKMLKEKADTLPKGEWVLGYEWNETFWEDQKMPTCKDLDKLIPDHPVYCNRIDGHTVLVNSKALEIAGITEDTPDPKGGYYERFPDGSHNGILHENHEQVLKCMPEKTEADIVENILYMGDYVTKYGVTGAIDNTTEPMMIRAYQQALDQGKLKYRAYTTWWFDKFCGGRSFEEELDALEKAPLCSKFGNDMVRFCGVKAIMDGVPAPGTALMREPYVHKPETSGIQEIPDEVMMKLAEICGKNHWQLMVHCCGDKAADITIKAMKHANEVAGNKDARHFLVHGVILWDDQLEIMREENIGVASQPGIFHLMGEEQYIGKRLGERHMPCGSCFSHGVITAGGTDFNIIEINPFIGMYGAVTRIASDGKVWGEEQKITPTEALMMWTRNSAYLMSADDKLGALAPGMLADVVVVDRDFIEGTPEELRDTKVLITMVDGKIVYEK